MKLFNRFKSLLKNIFKLDTLKEPVFYILLLSIILFSIGIFWGLPANETWQSDSLAPSTPLKGLIKGFSFGYFSKYPFVHQVILVIANIPVYIAAFVEIIIKEGFDPGAVYQILFTRPYTTALILVDRIVSVLMSAGIIFVVYSISKELFDKQTALFSSIIILLNVALNRYANVAKVEVPYLFWALLSLFYLIKLVKYNKTKYFILCPLFSLLAVGSKDQAYALFILPFLFYLYVYPLLFKKEEENITKIIFNKNNIIFIFTFIIVFLVVENLFFNFTGFIKRIKYLTGDAGFRSASYLLTPIGIIEYIIDLNKSIISTSMGILLYISGITGIVLYFFQNKNNLKKIFITYVLLFFAISYYLFFLQIIRQVDPRFYLVIAILLSIFSSYFLNEFYKLINRKFNPFIGKISVVILLILMLIYPGYLVLSYKINLIFDTRYRVEKWINVKFEDSSTVEYYTSNYSPRIPQKCKAILIKTIEPEVINVEKRKPDYIILCSKNFYRFLSWDDRTGIKEGMKEITGNQGKFSKSVFRKFIENLLAGEYNYKLIKRFDNNIHPFFKNNNYYFLIYKRVY